MNEGRPHERAICGAKTRSGSPCKNPPLANGRCRFHGGKSLTGMAVSSFKSGRYSKYLPGRLLEKYGEAVNDPELLALRDELALTESRIADLLSRVDSGESGELWKQAGEALDQFNEAFAAGSTDDQMEAAEELAYLLRRGQADYAAWREVMVMIEQRRKLSESERKRLVDAQQMITAEQAMVMVSAIIDTVRRNVSDRDTLAAIQNDITQLITR